MEYVNIVSIVCAAFAVSFGALGPALAEGRAVAAAVDAVWRGVGRQVSNGPAAWLLATCG